VTLYPILRVSDYQNPNTHQILDFSYSYSTRTMKASYKHLTFRLTMQMAGADLGREALSWNA